MNTNYGLPSGWTVMQQPKWKPYALQSLIDTNPYPAALAKLQKQKEDCGYTDKWYQDELRKMNKEWRNKVQSAIEENSRYIDEQWAEIAKVRATNFEHAIQSVTTPICSLCRTLSRHALQPRGRTTAY